jgi:hypothetical protein
MAKHPWKKLMKNVRESSRSKGYTKRASLSVTITWEDLKKQFEKQDGRCFWSNVPIDPMSVFNIRSPMAMSVDRIDNKKGYTKRNICLTIRFVNLGRRDSTYPQMMKCMKAIQSQTPRRK